MTTTGTGSLDFVDVSDEERQKMVSGNAVSLYDVAV